METWQIDNIKAILPALIQSTNCNTQVLAFLESKNILSDEEVETINSHKVKHKRAELLYQILPHRKDAYETLVKSLKSTKQTGAVDILEKFSTKKLKNINVLFLGKEVQLAKLITPEQLNELRNLLQKNFPIEDCPEFRETTVQLFRNTIPEPDPLYIPRFLSRRTTINPDLFKENCPDIFVFKNIDLQKLRKFNEFNGIVFSTDLLSSVRINCKLVILSLDTHWKSICSRLSVPAHLIRYDSQTMEFVLENTTGISDILHAYLEQTSGCSYISEDDFIESNLRHNFKGICICDSPGMGKSLLLANLARKLSKRCPDKIVAFFDLKEFKLHDALNLNTKSIILDKLSCSKLAACILDFLTISFNIKFVLLFDGLDEVKEEHFGATRAFLSKIQKDMPEVTVYISSRPVVEKELQQAAKATAYDILPFNKDNQITLLTSVWNEKFADLNQLALAKYARLCLEKIVVSTNENEKNIAGVPLLCKMIADVFSDDAISFVESGHFSTNISDYTGISLVEIYKKYMERQLGKGKCNFSCMEQTRLTKCRRDTNCQVKSFHVLHALKLLYPNVEKRKTEYASFEGLHLQQTLRPGLLKKKQQELKQPCALQFVHRTFAEYLVAEYLVTGVLLKCLNPQPQFKSMFSWWVPLSKPLIGFTVINEFMKFRENVVLYFVNALLNQSAQSLDIICKGYQALPEEDLSIAILNCVRFEYDKVLELSLKLQTKSNHSFWKSGLMNKNQPLEILQSAAKHCSVSTIKMIDKFYFDYYNFQLLKELPNKKEVSKHILRDEVKRGDYEVALLFIHNVSLTGHGLLACCLEHTYSESPELVDKRIDIARLLLSRCPSLIAEKHSNAPLRAKELHCKAIKFLVKQGAELGGKSRGDITFLDIITKRMSLEETRDLCHFIFVGRSVKDLIWVFARRRYLRLKTFTFRRIQALFKLLPEVKPNESELSVELFNLFWNAGISLETNQTADLEIRSLNFLLRREPIGALLFAVQDGDIVFANWLISYNRGFMELRNEQGETPLFHLIRIKQLKIFELLVSKIANVLAVDKLSRTILHTAAGTGDRRVFHRVLKILGNLREPKTTDCTTSSEFALTKAPTKIKELFEWTHGQWSRPILHLACEHLDMPLVTLDMLLYCGRKRNPKKPEKHKINVNALDDDGNSALLLALKWRKSFEFVKHLVKRGADWTAKDAHGRNAAHVCAQKGLSKHLKYFIKLGCDGNETDVEGKNALQIALDVETCLLNIQLVHILINEGVVILNKDREGKTAYDIAVKRNHPLNVLELLRNPPKKFFNPASILNFFN